MNAAVHRSESAYGNLPSDGFRVESSEAALVQVCGHPFLTLKDKVWVCHAVEQQAITSQYLRLDISPNEMHSPGNLRGIPREINGDVHLSKIRVEWGEFYFDNPNPTKQGLLDKATEIDGKYGHQFNPPVR